MVKFWTDRWHAKEPLCNSFLSLYALAMSMKHGSRFVGRLKRGGKEHWSSRFTRHFNY